MENDDDFNLRSSPMPESFFSVAPRKLKRLKKSDVLHQSESAALDSSDQPFSDPPIDLLKPTDNSSNFDHAHGIARRALAFDLVEKELHNREGNGRAKIVGEVSDQSTDLLDDKQKYDSEQKFKRGFGIDESKTKTKKCKTNDGENKPTATVKKMTEKERKNQLQHLHSETQRLMRESIDASFKPVPVVQKPISSILEKIRKRKAEVSKKTPLLDNNLSNDDLHISSSHEGDGNHVEVTTEDTSLLKDEKSIRCPDSSSVPLGEEFVEELKNMNGASFDTQDTFLNTEANNDSLEESSDEDSGLGEVFAPSLLAMNLKVDHVPQDECSSSDVDDNDKENINPYPDVSHNSTSSENADPVKAFVDDEAEEEDDSDNDLCLQESGEDSDGDNAEDLKDLIETGYEENKDDNEKRSQIHQKWLEQQDLNGTDNFLQRLRYGSKLRECFLDGEEENGGDVYKDLSNNNLVDIVENDSIKANSKKIKEMIPQMFTDKDDMFLSSDEEETEEGYAKRCTRLHDDVDTILSSPEKDESCSEFFGLIKKLNVIPATKKNTKVTGTFLDMSLSGSSIGFSKSSFVGRSSNHSLSSSRKQVSIKARHFIFGRDDSNSMDAVSMSEDSYDKVENENQQPKAATTASNFGNVKLKGTTVHNTVEPTAPSLLHVLRQPRIGGCLTQGGFSESVFSALRCAPTNTGSAHNPKL